MLLPGSRTSGGFALASPRSLMKSPLGAAARAHPELDVFEDPAPQLLEGREAPISRVPW